MAIPDCNTSCAKHNNRSMVIEMLIQHHVKYKEINGVDEIRLITQSEHRRIHHRLRKEGRCRVPVDELNVIVQKAHQRSPRRRSNMHNYNASIKRRIGFVEQIGVNVQLFERIIFNQNTGHVFVSSGFNINGHGRLPVVDEQGAVRCQV